MFKINKNAYVRLKNVMNRVLTQAVYIHANKMQIELDATSYENNV